MTIPFVTDRGILSTKRLWQVLERSTPDIESTHLRICLWLDLLGLSLSQALLNCLTNLEAKVLNILAIHLLYPVIICDCETLICDIDNFQLRDDVLVLLIDLHELLGVGDELDTVLDQPIVSLHHRLEVLLRVQVLHEVAVVVDEAGTDVPGRRLQELRVLPQLLQVPLVYGSSDLVQMSDQGLTAESIQDHIEQVLVVAHRSHRDRLVYRFRCVKIGERGRLLLGGRAAHGQTWLLFCGATLNALANYHFSY